MEFEQLRANADMSAERARMADYLIAKPDKTLALVAEMDMREPAPGVAVTYVCPMHSEVTSTTAGRCVARSSDALVSPMSWTSSR